MHPPPAGKPLYRPQVLVTTASFAREACTEDTHQDSDKPSTGHSPSSPASLTGRGCALLAHFLQAPERP